MKSNGQSSLCTMILVSVLVFYHQSSGATGFDISAVCSYTKVSVRGKILVRIRFKLLICFTLRKLFLYHSINQCLMQLPAAGRRKP
jgi:hypothetical protein